MNYVALAALLFAASFVPKEAFAQTGEPKYVKSATADLDGDGKSDTVTVTPGAQRFTVRVGNAALTVPTESLDDVVGFDLMTLAGNAKRRYIAVRFLGDTDYDHGTHFLYFDGAAIKNAGFVRGDTVRAQNGMVYASYHTGLWVAHVKYVPDAGGVLRHVPQAAYYVGVSGTVETGFAIRVSPTATGAVVATVAPGSKIELLLFKPYTNTAPGMAEDGYYLIKTQTGLCGWADFKAFKNKIPDLPFAG